MNKDYTDDDLTVADVPQLPLDDAADDTRASMARANVGKLIQQREERTNQVAVAVQEIEQLRSRQLQLEREKGGLESLTNTQDEYECAKRDVVAKLEKSVVTLEKQSQEALQISELSTAIRGSFEETLASIKAIDEDAWRPENFESELNQAIAAVEDAQRVFKKGQTKVKASGWVRDVEHAPSALDAPRDDVLRQNFGYWLVVGIAVSLPIVFVGVACFIVWLLLTGVL